MLDSKTRNRFILDDVILDDEPEANDYYEGYLNDIDSQYVGGFDWNTEMCVNDYFDNFEQYMDELSLALVPGQKLDKLMEIIKSTMMKHIEAERESLITSMISAMSEDELSEMKLRYGNGDYNYVLKQNSDVFGLSDESGEYITDVSKYVDIVDVDDDMIFDMNMLYGDSKEYCAECMCRDTCNRINCIYEE